MPVLGLVTYKVITFPGQLFQRGEVRSGICAREFHPDHRGSLGIPAKLEDGLMIFQEERVPVSSGQKFYFRIRPGQRRLKCQRQLAIVFGDIDFVGRCGREDRRRCRPQETRLAQSSDPRRLLAGNIETERKK